MALAISAIQERRVFLRHGRSVGRLLVLFWNPFRVSRELFGECCEESKEHYLFYPPDGDCCDERGGRDRDVATVVCFL